VGLASALPCIAAGHFSLTPGDGGSPTLAPVCEAGPEEPCAGNSSVRSAADQDEGRLCCRAGQVSSTECISASGERGSGLSWRPCDQLLLPRILTGCVALCQLLLAIPGWSSLQLCLQCGMLPVGRIFRTNPSCPLSGAEGRGMPRPWTCSVRVSPPFQPGTCPGNSLRACLLTFGVSWTSARV
jgi:hypothetical protein